MKNVYSDYLPTFNWQVVKDLYMLASSLLSDTQLTDTLSHPVGYIFVVFFEARKFPI